jgi:hypothetical protein
MIKPALTPDMIPFGSIASTTPFAQTATGNDFEEGHDALGNISSIRPNISPSKPKADRLKDSSKARGSHDNAAGDLLGEHKGGSDHEVNSDEISFNKKTVDKSTAGKESSVSNLRNTNVTPSKSSIGNLRMPVEDISSSPPPLEISRVRQSKRPAHTELTPAKSMQVSRIDKNERPIDITIHIGRIEVKAVQQIESQRSTHSFAAANQITSSAGPKSTAPHMTLNDYLRKRAEGKY